MGVQNRLIISQLSPPTILPTIYITVKEGDGVIITRQMIDDASPFFQEQGAKVGSIQIVNHEGNYQYLLSQTNTSNTRAYFINGPTRIYRTSNAGLVTNGYVDKSTIDSDGFFVRGVQISAPTTVLYRATAFDGNVESSLTTNVLGRIVIKVVSSINNKPNQLKSGTQEVTYGSMTSILGTTVTYLYNDPEDDIPYKVRIDGLPTKGRLLYLGTDCYVGQEILYSNVQAGMLTYWSNEGLASPGDSDYFNSTVSDVGSQQYY